MGGFSKEQLAFYDEHGYIVLDVLSDAEVEEISNEYDDIFHRKADDNLEATWGGKWKDTDKKTEMLSIHGLQMHSAVFTRLLLHTGVLDALEAVMRTHNILLHHSKAHTKPPGTGSPFPMHQDYHYFPFKNDSMVAVFYNLDDSDPANGGLCVYPGSHKLGPQKDVSDDKNTHYLDQELFPLAKATPLTLKKGQVVLFSYLLVHGSYHNVSQRQRRMFLAQVVSAEDEMLRSMHRSAAQGLVLRGRNVNRSANIAARHNDDTT